MIQPYIDELKGLWNNKRMLAFQGLHLAMIVMSALMVWKGLMAVTRSDSPVVVVLSGSMETTLFKGDILLLHNSSSPIEIGEIVVFQVKGRDIPIVHRVLEKHVEPDGHEMYLTKGDHNLVHDRGLYAEGDVWLERKDILGRAIAFAPYVGYVTILLTDYPMVKVGALMFMAWMVLTGRE